jgi:hypothetical protein
MAYFEMFSRDAARMLDALTRINVMPLGCAALAGTTYPIDRDYVAELLDFPEVSDNSMDAVADRDFVLEFLSAASRLHDSLQPALRGSDPLGIGGVSDSSIWPMPFQPAAASCPRRKTPIFQSSPAERPAGSPAT